MTTGRSVVRNQWSSVGMKRREPAPRDQCPPRGSRRSGSTAPRPRRTDPRGGRPNRTYRHLRSGSERRRRRPRWSARSVGRTPWQPASIRSPRRRPAPRSGLRAHPGRQATSIAVPRPRAPRNGHLVQRTDPHPERRVRDPPHEGCWLAEHRDAGTPAIGRRSEPDVAMLLGERLDYFDDLGGDLGLIAPMAHRRAQR